MAEKISLSIAAGMLVAADDILILTHRNPDGDTIGSAAALCSMLRQAGRRAYVMKNQTLTMRLSPYVEAYFPPKEFSPSFLCAVDIADQKLFCDDAADYKDKIDLCIDHHITNTYYAKAVYVRESAAACGEIMLDLSRELGLKLSGETALPAYLAICTDTGCFKYSSVTADTLRLAAEAIDTGIDFYTINNKFFEIKSRPRVLLEGALLRGVEFFHGSTVALACLTAEDIANAEATDDDMDNLSAVVREIEGVDIGILIRQRDDTWKVSIRTSRAANAADICVRLGGGGHARAAGCSVRDTLESTKARVMNAVNESISIGQ